MGDQLGLIIWLLESVNFNILHQHMQLTYPIKCHATPGDVALLLCIQRSKNPKGQ